MGLRTVKVTSFNSGGFEVKHADSNIAFATVREYIDEAFRVDRVDFMGIQEARDKVERGERPHRTFEANDYFDSVETSDRSSTAILYNKKA